MFKDVGAELKGWAKFFVVLETLLCVILGAWLWSVVGGLLGFVVCALISVIGYFFARMSGLMLYAFGELVETVVDIDTGMDMLLKNKQNNP